MHRRTLLSTIGSIAALGGIRPARADTVGVTATEIKIGHTIPYSGPASAYGSGGKGHAGFFRRLNEQGGVNGRKINFISLDDGYSPPKTVEQIRRLVEQDQVSFVFNPLGTPSNTAIQRYMNQKQVPQLFVATGADKWGNYKDFPWTMGWAPSYRTESQIYAKYILANRPAPKIAVIYQNDDYGKDYLSGLREGLGGNYGKFVIKEVSYEVTDATVDSQAVSMQGSGADVLFTIATPKFAAQMIRKVYDLNWKPMHILNNVGSSAGAVMIPAGPEKGVGIISSTYLKDATDAAWANDPGILEWREFMKKYVPDGDVLDSSYVYSYGVCQTVLQTLKQCGDDLSRENIMRQAANLRDLDVSVLLPGIKVNTSPTNFHPIRQLQLMKWTGTTWERFGNILADTAV